MSARSMWELQAHFLLGVTVRAEAFLRGLDPALDPAVLLVGRREPDAAGCRAVCIDPPDEDTLQALADLDARVAAARQGDPQASRALEHPLAEDLRRERVERHALRAGVASALDQAHPGRCSFAGQPQQVGPWLVAPVVQVDRAAWERHPALPEGRFAAPLSLLEAALAALLDSFSDALRDPSPGADPLPASADEDLMRAAGRALMGHLGRRSGGIGRDPGLFDRVCDIASLPYEGLDGTGRLIVTPGERSGVQVLVAFAEPVPLQRRRAARKLLEMAADDLCLLATPQVVYGLGRRAPEGEEAFEVEFLGRGVWELSCGRRALMRVQDGAPSLPGDALSRARFESVSRRVFSGVEEVDHERLWRLVELTRSLGRGALLVCSSGAEAEARRLARQGTPLAPVVLTAELVRAVTAIDGAVLLDPAGRCHAVGVVLDGLAAPLGDPGRGSRYNSAVRYVETARRQLGHRVVAVVMSEDGMVDLLPALRPQLRRVELEARMEALRRAAQAPASGRAAFSRALGWLRAHAFWLDRARCQEVTRLAQAFEARWAERHPEALPIRWAELTPHPELDDSYLLDD